MKKLLLGLGAVAAVATPVVAVVACSDSDSDKQKARVGATTLLNNIVKLIKDAPVTGNANDVTREKATLTKVTTKLTDMIKTSTRVIGRATGDSAQGNLSNHNYDHNTSMIRVLNNDNQHLKIQFIMSIADTKTIFPTENGGVVFEEDFTEVIESALNTKFPQGDSKKTSPNGHVTAGFFKSVSTGDDDFFKLTLYLDKSTVQAQTGITLTNLEDFVKNFSKTV